MMREIKFRAWNTHKPFGQGELKEMVYFDLFELDETYINTSGTYLEGDYKLMQYTGLKDKNGKEIYESDRVKVRLHHTPGIQGDAYDWEEFDVEWDIGKARFILVDDNGDTWSFDDSNEIEVMGNKYEME